VEGASGGISGESGLAESVVLWYSVSTFDQFISASPAVWPAAPIAVRGAFEHLRALQARLAPSCPRAHCPVKAPDVTGCCGISCSEHFLWCNWRWFDAPTTQWDGGNRQVPPGKPPRRRTDSLLCCIAFSWLRRRAPLAIRCLCCCLRYLRRRWPYRRRLSPRPAPPLASRNECPACP
jgi:hypothetical protein